MALPNYAPFSWPIMGSPLVPFIGLRFRSVTGSNYLYFPNKTNRVYIESATFNVLDDSGYSTASITLVDPDFSTLEVIFSMALFSANSMTAGQGNWYCSAFWGWSYYGQEWLADGEEGQRKSSGIHYYLLKDLRYDLTDIELRVTFDLMDIGFSAFNGDSTTKVGKLDPGNGVTHGIAGVDGTTQGEGQTASNPEEEIVRRWNTNNPDEPLEAFVGDKGIDFRPSGGGPSTSPTGEGESQPPPVQNIITGKTYWQIIQIICTAHSLNAIARISENDPEEPKDGPAPGEGGGTVYSEEYGRVIISSDDILTDAIQKMLENIANQPKVEDTSVPTKKWDILAGGKLNPKAGTGNENQPDMDVVFGWVPQPPKGEGNLEDNYRLARVLTYRPGTKGEVARGETMVTGLTYEWTSKGFWQLGLPRVYVEAPDEEGAHSTYLTLDDFKNVNPAEVQRIKSAPSVKEFPLDELAGKLGVKIEFNFDSRTESKERIEAAAGSIIINVWNFFLRELVNITIDTPGDPWLDNHIFSGDADGSTDNLLVDLYHSYFKVKVYKMSDGIHEGRASALSEILSGNYLCLKGCSHNINQGEYTTTLQLMKAF